MKAAYVTFPPPVLVFLFFPVKACFVLCSCAAELQTNVVVVSPFGLSLSAPITVDPIAASSKPLPFLWLSML